MCTGTQAASEVLPLCANCTGTVCPEKVGCCAPEIYHHPKSKYIIEKQPTACKIETKGVPKYVRCPKYQIRSIYNICFAESVWGQITGQ